MFENYIKQADDMIQRFQEQIKLIKKGYSIKKIIAEHLEIMVTYAESDGWYDSVELIITELYGSNSPELQKWNTRVRNYRFRNDYSEGRAEEDCIEQLQIAISLLHQFEAIYHVRQEKRITEDMEINVQRGNTGGTLDKRQKKLQQALLSAYTSEADLRRMVQLGLGKNLNEIAGGNNLNEITFNLIMWSKQYGGVDDLIIAAYRENSNNPELKAFVKDYFGGLPNPKEESE